MGTRVQQICDHFKLYEHLLSKAKSIRVEHIQLESKNATWDGAEQPILHDSIEEVLFNVGKQSHGQKYGLRLFVKSLHSDPVYYFDSDGPAHFNSDGKTRLLESKIDTPHINFYDQLGVKRAKRPPFIDENVEALQSDINLGMEFFCRETNINSDQAPPRIMDDSQLRLFQDAKLDIHDGISFDTTL